MIAKPKPAFQFFGGGDACLSVPAAPDPCAGVEALVSSKGIAACAVIFTLGYVWNSGPFGELGGCDLKDTPASISAFTATARAGAGAGGDALRVRVRAGLPAAGFLATGTDGSPRLTVTDPRGRRYVDDGRVLQQGSGFAIARLPQRNQTMVKITGRPRPGTWKVATQPGSPEISRVALHEGRAPTRIRARVRGRGAGRRLLYTVAPVPGQTVTFFEQGPSVGRQLGVARGRRGSLVFPKAYGAPGRRQIFAIVSHEGMPRDKVNLTSYVAPSPPRVPKPRGLSAKASRSALVLRWKRVRGAASYQLLTRIGDGRVLNLKTKRTSTRIPFSRALSARVRLIAVAGDGRDSKPAKLRVKAKRRRVVIRL